MNISILLENETMDKIYNDKCSICRFGDGEIYHLFRTNPEYGSGGQNCCNEIRNKLIAILNNTNEKILIGFSGYFNEPNIIENEYYTNMLSKTTKSFFTKYRQKLFSSFPNLFEMTLYSAEITRLKQLKQPEYIISKFDKLFLENECIFVGNNNIIEAIKFHFIDKFKTITFINGPNNNAYLDYDKIYQNIITQNGSKNKLILISLGITATIMSYELAENGYWVIDIGHYFEMLF
jgi:hypothetical protein